MHELALAQELVDQLVCRQRVVLRRWNDERHGVPSRTALGLPVQVFVEIALSSQSQEALSAFETAVTRFDEILECHLTTGRADYLLRVVARDVADYDDIHRNCLARLPGVSSMQTIFVLRAIREFRGYPVRVS